MIFHRYERRQHITLEGRKAAAFHRRQARAGIGHQPALNLECTENLTRGATA